MSSEQMRFLEMLVAWSDELPEVYKTNEVNSRIGPPLGIWWTYSGVIFLVQRYLFTLWSVL